MKRPPEGVGDGLRADIAVPPVKHLALKIVLSIILIGLMGFQLVVLPVTVSDMAEMDQPSARLLYSCLALSMVWFVSPLVVVVSTWRLADLVAQGHIFSDRPFWWVNAMAYSAFAGCVPIVLMAGLLGANHALHPGVFFAMVGAAMACLGVGLIVLVLRGLLRRAVLMRDELDVVI